MTSLPSIPEQQRYWDERWERTPRPNAWQIRRGETVMTYIRQLPLERPRILDMGCGTGWFTEALSHVGQVTGIDLSEEAIALAWARFPGVDFVAGDVYERALAAPAFDIVVSQEVIARVEDQQAYIELAATYHRPGGHDQDDRRMERVGRLRMVHRVLGEMLDRDTEQVGKEIAAAGWLLRPPCGAIRSRAEPRRAARDGVA